MKLWDQARIELVTPGSAVWLATNCTILKAFVADSVDPDLIWSSLIMVCIVCI